MTGFLQKATEQKKHLNKNITFKSKQKRAGWWVRIFNPFQPTVLFLYHLKTWENLRLFWRFQGRQKWNIGSRWVMVWMNPLFFLWMFTNFSQQLFCKTYKNICFCLTEYLSPIAIIACPVKVAIVIKCGFTSCNAYEK